LRLDKKGHSASAWVGADFEMGAGAGDLFAGIADEVGDVEQLRHEARCVAMRCESIGFQQGVLDARQAHVQEGFDAGYCTAAIAAFCAAFEQELSQDVMVTATADCVTPKDLHRRVRAAITAAIESAHL